MLRGCCGRTIGVKLKNGGVYVGTLVKVDEFMNLQMQDVEEGLNGRVMDSYARITIRGNNVVYMWCDAE